MDRGMFAALGLVSVIAVALCVLAPPLRLSQETLRTMAGIGASFFLGFIVEATWFIPFALCCRGRGT